MGADEPQEPTEPSLAPPRLFRRRVQPTVDPPSPEQAPAVAQRDVPPAPVPQPAAREDVAPEAATSEAHDRQASLFTDSGSDTSQQVVAPVVIAQAERAPRRPLVVPATLTAALVGLVTGMALLGLMWVGFRGCDALSGTASCGKGPGLVALVVIFSLTVVVGRVLLGLLKLPEPLMTSFLAVGVTSLVATLLLSGLFDSAAILVVLPLLSAAAFAGSWWVATQQVDLDA